MKRKEAIKLGLKKYNTGKFCSKGHKSPRYTSSGVCVACNRIRLAKWVKDGAPRPTLILTMEGVPIMNEVYMCIFESRIMSDFALQCLSANTTSGIKPSAGKAAFRFMLRYKGSKTPEGISFTEENVKRAFIERLRFLENNT